MANSSFKTVTMAFTMLTVSSIYVIVSIPMMRLRVPVSQIQTQMQMQTPTQKQVQLLPELLLSDGSNYDRKNAVVENGDVSVLVQALEKHSFRLRATLNYQNINNTFNELQVEQLNILNVLINYFSNGSIIPSDVVELRHCQQKLLHQLDFTKFSVWASIIIHDAWQTIEKKIKANFVFFQELKGLPKDRWDETMYLEFCLGLLEVYATHATQISNNNNNFNKICNFDNYPLHIEHIDDQLRKAESILRNVPVSSSFINSSSSGSSHRKGDRRLPRLVFVIVAYQDADHLKVLIEACYMSHHLIIIHLERWSPQTFTDKVHRIANKYSNVAVIQFGSIIYTTDSVSMINYKIMNWLINEVQISFDFLFTLGNAVYPLHDIEGLTRYLQRSKRNIWLGEIRNNKNNAGWVSLGYLERKRLIFTSGKNNNNKYTQRTKKWKQNDFVSMIPEYIKTNMVHKTNSGNQAVFSYEVVKKLVESPIVKELFAIAKYGCCCCLEERTWIAAAQIIGFGGEAMERATMFQVWGGESSSCGVGSMKNAILTLKKNETICYKSEDATKGNIVERRRRRQQGNNNSSNSHIPNAFFRGDELIEELRQAKQRGFLFARKFKSDDESYQKLIGMIKKYVH